MDGGSGRVWRRSVLLLKGPEIVRKGMGGSGRVWEGLLMKRILVGNGRIWVGQGGSDRIWKDLGGS